MTEPSTARILEIAEARSTAARSRLSATLSLLQSRLTPRALAQEAASNLVLKSKTLAADGVETAKRNPATVAGGAAAVGLVLARRPIARLLHRLWSSDDDATPPDTKSLKSARRTTAEERNEQ